MNKLKMSNAQKTGLSMNRFIFVTIFALSFLTLSYSHIPSFLKNSKLNEIKGAERILGQDAVKFELKDVSPGHYYFSLGRTSVSCNVKTSNGYGYRATSLDNRKRISLIAGFDFVVSSQTQDLSINVSCPNRAPKTYKIQPFMASYQIGMMMNVFELLFYVIMAPFSSLVVFLSSVYLLKRGQTTDSGSFNDYKNLLAFSLCTFLYSISFSQIPKLFFDSYFTATNHMLIRFLLHASFLYFISQGISKRIRFGFVASYVFGGLSLFIVAKLIGIGTASDIYGKLLFTFPLTAFFFLVLKKDKFGGELNRLEFLKLAMLGTYMLNSLHDAISWFVGSSTYSTPGTLMFISTSIAVALQIQSEVETKINMIKDKTEELFQKSSTLIQYLEKLSTLFRREFGFERASVYVDGQIFGHPSGGDRCLLRVFEDGYSKETKKDKKIAVLKDQASGRRMIDFDGNEVGCVKYGDDGGLYSIVPYERTIFINLSSSIKAPLYELSFQRLIFSNFNRIQDRVKVHLNQLIVDARSHEAENLLQQLTHDAQSPLSVLEFIGQHIGGENKRKLFNGAIQRLHNILKHPIQTDQSGDFSNNQVDTLAITSILEKVVKEKQALNSCSIEYSLDDPGLLKGKKALYSVELERAFSNILNNAIEASEQNCNISVNASLSNNSLNIKFQDNGTGVPPEYLATIFEKGASFKSGGSGLGLYHAKVNTEKVGGKINFESTFEKGSTVTISLPII